MSLLGVMSHQRGGLTSKANKLSIQLWSSLVCFTEGAAMQLGLYRASIPTVTTSFFMFRVNAHQKAIPTEEALNHVNRLCFYFVVDLDP